MNIGKLIFAIQEKIADSTTTALDLLMLKKALEKLEVGAVDVLPYYSSLPDATLNTGKLYYVSADEILYWSAGDSWRSIRTISSIPTWSWGNNSSGQLGDNTIIGKSSPILTLGIEDWKKLSVGGSAAAGIRTNGTAWAWGLNSNGSLGINAAGNRSSPVSIVGGFTDWSEISLGFLHGIGLRANGTIWAWGCNTSGQLGDGTTVAKSSPVSIVGGIVNWCQIGVGCTHSMGLTATGQLWAWGRGEFGILGDGTTVNKSSPVSVVGGFTDWCKFDGGSLHSAGVRSNGSIWAWGYNVRGTLGNGTTVNRSSPVSVVGGFTDWCGVSLGSGHGVGLRTNGTLWSWGENVAGRLGDGTTVNKSSPVSVVGGFTDWCNITVGSGHGVGLRTNGTLWAWGCNNCGQLGDGTTVSKSSPVSVIGGFTNWTITGNSNALSFSSAALITKQF